MTFNELAEELLEQHETSNITVYKIYIVAKDEEHSTACKISVGFTDFDGDRKLISCLDFDSYLNIAPREAKALTVKLVDNYWSKVYLNNDYEKVNLYVLKDRDLEDYKQSKVNANIEEDSSILDKDVFETTLKEYDNHEITIVRISCNTVEDAVNHILLS